MGCRRRLKQVGGGASQAGEVNLSAPGASDPAAINLTDLDLDAKPLIFASPLAES